MPSKDQDNFYLQQYGNDYGNLLTGCWFDGTSPQPCVRKKNGRENVLRKKYVSKTCFRNSVLEKMTLEKFTLGKIFLEKITLGEFVVSESALEKTSYNLPSYTYFKKCNQKKETKATQSD